MKGLLSIFLLLNLTISFPVGAEPTIHSSELQQYLSELEWSEDNLHEYLHKFDLSLDDFHSTAELKKFLGKQNTEENLTEVLTKYSLTNDELELLLAKFGEEINDFKFIKDIDNDVSFYLNHDADLNIISDFLSLFGLTSQELIHLIHHFHSIDQSQISENINVLSTKISEYEAKETETDESYEALLNIWVEMFDAFHIRPEFYITTHAEDVAIPVTDLSEVENIHDNILYVKMYNEEGMELADMNFSSEVLDNDLLGESVHEVLNLAQLSANYTETVLGKKLPQTATPYLMNSLFGLGFSIISLLLFIGTRKLFLTKR
ncbi:processed acidic surface protein [Anaerobacillus sp. MEB173]|uniref:processed acidic surface protein n=1 Tax=Anaerobacillus sp. MEB173 TaxID=3383345 RepID=UPI003F91D7B5